MAHNWKVLGHKKQLDFLSKSIDSGKLAHAYIFAGPENVGKFFTAENLAQILVCEKQTACNECVQCKTFATKANPDFIQMRQDETIKIEQIRQLIYQLSLKPYSAKYKVAVIDKAEDMTVEATNALLKSLEEPKPYTIIILVTSNPYRLLPTILSRAQKISFGLVETEAFESLIPNKLSKEEKVAIQTLAVGRPGLVVQALNNPEILQSLQDLEKQFESFMSGDLADRLILAHETAELETPQIKNVLQYWLSGLEKKLNETPSKKLAETIIAVNRSKNLVDANVNAKLLLSTMMLYA